MRIIQRRGERGGGTQELPHEIVKIVVENWCYIPQVLSEKNQKSKKYLVENVKSPFPVEIFIKFLKTFQNLLHFWSKKFAGRFLTFQFLMEIIYEMLITLNSGTNYSRLSPKFSSPFPLVRYGSKLILLMFWLNS